jgi:predicted metal-dependent peptidase
MSNIKENTGQTDGVGPRGKKLTPEQMAKNDGFDIGPYFISLFWDEPFFASIYMRVSRIQTREFVPTAGVAIVDDRPTLLWNPDFVASLPKRHVLGLLKHEAYHLIYSHCTNRRKEPHLIWNWGTDLSINCVIKTEELPEGGLVPGKPLRQPDPEDWAEMTPEQQARHTHLSQLIASLPTEKTAEWYFERLMSDSEIKKMVAEIKAAEALGKALRDAIREALGKGGMGEGMDSHDIWGKALDRATGELKDLPDGVRQLLEGEMKQALQEAVSRADSSNAWGTIPASMQRTLRDMVSTEIDWRVVLRQFVGASRRAESKNSRKKVNRKDGAIYEQTGVRNAFPGRSRSHTANIAVFVDQSGSVDDRSLELLYGELRSMAKRTTFTFFPFDTEVDEANSFVWKRGQGQPALNRFRCGGTDYQACVNYIAAHKGQFDGMIIMTDGECGRPTPACVRLAYVICPNRRLLFEPHPNDIVVKMKDVARE